LVPFAGPVRLYLVPLIPVPVSVIERALLSEYFVVAEACSNNREACSFLLRSGCEHVQNDGSTNCPMQRLSTFGLQSLGVEES
jgi:hypothetical protein